MSSEAQPISAAQFALAIRELPLENIYSKAHEIDNSISHLQRSNAQLQEYSDSIRADPNLEGSTRDEGDKDCLEAIRENEMVIARQKERVGLLKAEVERRGSRWHEGRTGGEEEDDDHAVVENGTSNGGRRSGRLTDEELRQRMEERLRDNDEDDGGDGMHL